MARIEAKETVRRYEVKPLLAYLLCVVLLVGAGVWIGRRSLDEREIRRAVIAELARCTIEDAHAEKCFIPCASDEDCIAKNGQADH